MPRSGHRAGALLVLPLSVCTATCGEETLRAVPIVLPDPGTIVGRVCDKTAGTWVAAASVTADDANGTRTSTDADGSFSLALPPGEYTLVIDGPQYHSERNVIVRAGEVTDIGVATCDVERGDVHGRACNEAQEAWVDSGEARLVARGVESTTVTDPFGRFSFAAVPVGSHTITVTLGDFVEAYPVEVVAFQSAFAGDVSCGPLGSVQGRICGATGYWLSGARVFVTLEDGSVVETTTDPNGYFTLVDVPAGDQTVMVTKGSFATSFPVAVVGHDTVYLAEPICIPPTTRIAVVTGVYDSVEDVLGGLGYDIRATFTDSVTPTIVDVDGTVDLIEGYGSFWVESFLADSDWLSDYQIVFFNCGLDDWELESPSTEAEAALANLRAFVENGGSVYASDWASSVVIRTFPDRIDYFGDDADLSAAKVGKDDTALDARVVDAPMQAALGRTSVTLNLNLSAWVVLAATADQPDGLRLMVTADVVVIDPDTWDESEHDDAPLLVQFQHGLGRVLYTSFHNEAQTTQDMREILNYLVFEL